MSTKVLITGGTGFIGSHLIPRFVEKAYDVYSLERYVTGRYSKWKECKTFFGDLREHHAMRMIIKQLQPDIVIHLAAISPVLYSNEHYDEIMDVNLKGTINLAETCLREIQHFKHFLFASTSETYGLCPRNPKGENDRLIPNSPYAVSKVACENYLNYLHEAYDFPVTILKPFNTYGRKKDYHFIVERAIVQMLKNDVCYLGDPNQIRDFLYVDDHVNAYLTCLETPDKSLGETFNFCTEIGTSIRDLVKEIARLTQYSREVKWRTIPAGPLDIERLVGSYKKARAKLGWKPQFLLQEGLKGTIDYWREKT